MTTPSPLPAQVLAAAIGLRLPPECLEGVTANLALLGEHLKIVRRAADR